MSPRGALRDGAHAPARGGAPGLALLGGAALVLIGGVVVFGAARGMLGAPGAPAPRSAGAIGLAEAVLLARTCAIAALIGALAALLGAPAGWSMRRLAAPWAALLLAPALLPSYLVYSSWSLLRAPGTALGDWLFRAGGPALLQRVSGAQAILGLALWASPLAALVIGARARAIPSDSIDAMRQQAWSAPARLRWWTRLMWPALAAGAGVVALVMLGSAVPLHLAEVGTYAIVVWKRMDETAGARSAWVSAAPLLAVALVLGAAFGAGAARARDPGPDPRSPWGGERDTRIAPVWLILAALVWALGAFAPLALFLANLRDPASVARFWATYAGAVGRSGALAAACGAVVALVGVCASAGFGASRGSASRALASGSLGAWAALGIAPGVLVGAGVARASTAPGMGWLTSGDAGLIVAHGARFGFVGALAGWWLASRETRDSRDARMQAGGGARAWWLGAGRAQTPGLVAAGLAGATLSFHELESGVLVSAPGRDTLPRHMLALLHYLRVEELNAGASQVMALGLVGSVCAALLFARARAWGRAARALAPLLALAPLACVMPGCSKVNARAPESRQRADVRVVFGETGKGAGQVVYPRAIDFDPEGEGSVWVIDKTARVQRVSLAGEPMAGWPMPDSASGKPTGVTLGPDGLVYVPDTHYQRVMVYSRAGELVRSFGSYGAGPGQFVYPTDVAVAPSASGSAERIYVSEYGGNDRVSCFDGAGVFLFSFGREGSADSSQVEFSRAQSIAWDAPRSRLLVTDAGNHRVGVFEKDGALVRWIGRRDASLGPVPGEPTAGAPACFNYPYGLALLADGDAVVSEFGGGRIQRFDPETGACVEICGGPGRERGEFAYPWGVCAGAVEGDKQWVWALDSGNARVQGFLLRLRKTPEGAP